jgi:hypothetical protein
MRNTYGLKCVNRHTEMRLDTFGSTKTKTSYNSEQTDMWVLILTEKRVSSVQF